MEDTDVRSAPQDVANLYSWAGLDETKYRLFAASREEARAQTRERKGLVEAEVARQKFEEEEMRRRAVDAVAASSKENLAPPGVTATEEPATDEGLRHGVEGAREPARGDGAHGQTGDEVGTQSLGSYSEGRGEADVSRDVERRRVKPDVGRMWQEESSSGSQYLEPRPVVMKQVSEVHPRFQEQAPQRATEREAASTVAIGQQIDFRPRGGEGLQPIKRNEEPRWAALQDFFTPVKEDRRVRGSSFNVPTVAMFSLMGGAGKTSMVAALGRIFAAQGEHVLLLDANAYGVLPFYFGARNLRPGLVRSFSQNSTLPPIQVLSIDPEMENDEEQGVSWLPETLFRDTRGVQRVLIDVATGSAAMTRRVLQLSPTVLVPLQPNMTSVVNLQAVEAFLRRHAGEGKGAPKPYYILSQFDASISLHRDVQEVLRQQLGDRLLPFVMRRSAAVNEALADGMTVVDYAPDSGVVEDLLRLSAWVQSLGSSAASSAPALRWREL